MINGRNFSSIKFKLESFLVWAVLVQILGGYILFAMLLLQSFCNNWEYISCKILELLLILLYIFNGWYIILY